MNDERLQDALILLKLISQSKEELRKGNWFTQAQVEQQMRERFPELLQFRL